MSDRSPGFQQRTALSVGNGAIAQLPEALRGLEVTRPGLLIDANLEALGERIAARLDNAAVIRLDPGEPTVTAVKKATALISEARVDGVVALGGGSAIDTAKLARAFLASGAESLSDIPDTFATPPLPLIAAPTTAGTGAEVGAGAIVFDEAVSDKVLFRRAPLAADIAIADGELTLGLPPRMTAYTGLDAFAQALMAFVSAGEDSVSGQNALIALSLIREHLPTAYATGGDATARGKMMLGSVLSALAMYNAPPTYAGEHVFAEPMGAMLGIHHGHAVAATLAGTIEYNLTALETPLAALARHDGLADRNTPDAAASAAFLADIHRLVSLLEVPPLTDDLQPADLASLLARCEQHDGYAQNPRRLTQADTAAILRGAFDGSFTVVYGDREGAHV